MADAEREVLSRSNAFRHSQGRAPTRAEPLLSATAQDYAAHMARTGRYGHEADGREPAQRVQAHGYAYCSVSENVAFQQRSSGFTASELAGAFVQGWIDSPGHQRNLLAADVTDTGVAIARSPSGDRYYAVQLFARPAALRVRFELSNRSRQALRYDLDGRAQTLAPGVTRTHEQCTTPRLSIALPGQAAPTELQPADGARLQVEPAGAGLRLIAP
jgi:hypothetical protein